MKRKTSIRYFMGKPVRAIWDEEGSEWWFSATDVAAVFSGSPEPRRYWNNLKRRRPELQKIVRQHYLYSSDGKSYLNDTLDEKGISLLSLSIPAKQRKALLSWIAGSLDSIDEQSKKRAYELYRAELIDPEDVGKTKSLQQIHVYLFGGLYDFAGKIRTLTISKGGFTFANGDYLPQTLAKIDAMDDSSFDAIVDKYVEMNVAHPFMEGNGRSTRIWLDMLLRERIGCCVDWSKIDKSDYLSAMAMSPSDPTKIHDLLKAALTDKIDDREIFMKGIDYSYYYEEVE